MATTDADEVRTITEAQWAEARKTFEGSLSEEHGMHEAKFKTIVQLLAGEVGAADTKGATWHIRRQPCLLAEEVHGDGGAWREGPPHVGE